MWTLNLIKCIEKYNSFLHWHFARWNNEIVGDIDGLVSVHVTALQAIFFLLPSGFLIDFFFSD